MKKLKKMPINGREIFRDAGMIQVKLADSESNIDERHIVTHAFPGRAAIGNKVSFIGGGFFWVNVAVYEIPWCNYPDNYEKFIKSMEKKRCFVEFLFREKYPENDGDIRIYYSIHLDSSIKLSVYHRRWPVKK